MRELRASDRGARRRPDVQLFEAAERARGLRQPQLQRACGFARARLVAARAIGRDRVRRCVARASASELDPGLGLDALLERVLDLAHLRDEVGVVDQLLRRVAAGDDDVRARRARLQELDHLVGREPAVRERVRELVERDDVVLAGGDLRLAVLPQLARERLVLLDVLRQPGEAAAERDRSRCRSSSRRWFSP